MSGKAERTEQQPSVEEIRTELARITANAPCAHSPQLANFLRFVVEATLDGRSDRLRGYTVGVEALGRPADFDPQIDPIVRVEAARLRRTLARYYAGDGRDDEIAIDLERGSYVPRFSFRTIERGSADRFGRMGNRVHGMSARARHHVFIGGLLALGAGAYAAADFAFLDAWLRVTPTHSLASGQTASLPRSRHGPILLVEPVKIVGTPEPDTISVASLRHRLLDAFARFDDVNVVSDLAPLTIRIANPKLGRTAALRNPDYRLVTLARYDRNRSATLVFQLFDMADGTIAWSRSFEQLSPMGEIPASKTRVIRDLAMPLLQPFGVIHARERLKHVNADAADPYRCLLDSYDYLRSFDRTRHAGVRNCLEHAIADDPNFASGMVQLARVYLREHQFGIDVRPGDPPALDRAFAMAERALASKPSSARAHFVLYDLHLARGDLAGAKAEAERAVALNPNDMPVAFHYGALLVLLGEVERGEAIVREVANDSVVPPGRLNFILFVASYLRGDLGAAGDYAKQMVGNPMPLGCFTRALVAAKIGDGLAAKQEMQCLAALHPGWRDNPGAELKKLFPAAAVRDRIAADFATVTN